MLGFLRQPLGNQLYPTTQPPGVFFTTSAKIVAFWHDLKLFSISVLFGVIQKNHGSLPPTNDDDPNDGAPFSKVLDRSCEGSWLRCHRSILIGKL